MFHHVKELQFNARVSGPTRASRVCESLDFLMTREVTHFQSFSAALSEVVPNFPPGVLQANPKYSHAYFNMSNGQDVRGPWNQGQGPWTEGEWVCISDPVTQVRATRGQLDQRPEGTSFTESEVEKLNRQLSEKKSDEIMSQSLSREQQWSSYDTELTGIRR